MSQYNGKTARFMTLAKNVANQSTYSDYRHGAVLVRGGSVINTSPNKDGHCAFAKRFRKREEGIATVHAEVGAILGLDRSVTEGATLYVARIGKAGEFRMSKPCNMCVAVLKHCGVKKVVFTIDKEEVGRYKL